MVSPVPLPPLFFFVPPLFPTSFHARSFISATFNPLPIVPPPNPSSVTSLRIVTSSFYPSLSGCSSPPLFFFLNSLSLARSSSLLFSSPSPPYKGTPLVIQSPSRRLHSQLFSALPSVQFCRLAGAFVASIWKYRKDSVIALWFLGLHSRFFPPPRRPFESATF